MALMDFFFPISCCGCQKSGSYLCFGCKKTLLPHPELCPSCHNPSPSFKTCPSCILKGECFLDGLIIGFAYQKLLKKLLLKLKFQHVSSIASFLAERGSLLVQLNPYLVPLLSTEQLMVSFVPSHRYRKYFQKGYNQSELIAEALAEQLKVKLWRGFQKKRATTSQVKLDRKARMKNLVSAFALRDVSEVKSGMTILIVDDVTTTGATLNELAKTLKSQRPDLIVWGLVLARHMG